MGHDKLRKCVNIYIGGYDMAEGGDAIIAYREIKQLLHERNGHNCTVYFAQLLQEAMQM
jgi:hypothetical protein